MAFNHKASSIFFLALCFVMSGCYSFKGISIPPSINTFYVDQFQNSTPNSPPDLGQQFSESLRDIVLRSSRLNYDDSAPDIEFVGAVRSFDVSSVAPERNEDRFTSSLNRLTISVQVDYINNIDDEDTWSQSFSFFEDFESDEDLANVQDELIANIFDQLTQDIFNRAFTNW